MLYVVVVVFWKKEFLVVYFYLMIFFFLSLSPTFWLVLHMSSLYHRKSNVKTYSFFSVCHLIFIQPFPLFFFFLLHNIFNFNIVMYYITKILHTSTITNTAHIQYTFTRIQDFYFPSSLGKQTKFWYNMNKLLKPAWSLLKSRVLHDYGSFYINLSAHEK